MSSELIPNIGKPAIEDFSPVKKHVTFRKEFKNGRPENPARKHYLRQRDERDRQIYEKHICEGQTITQLAAEYKLHRDTIRDAIRRQEKIFVAEHKFEIEAIKQDHSERLEKLYTEALAAFEKSKRDAEAIQATEGGGDGSDGRTVRTTKKQCGDVSYLLAAAGFLEDIRKIWGADEPLQVKVGGIADLQGVATPVPTKEELQAKIDERLKVLYGIPDSDPRAMRVGHAAKNSRPA